MKIPEFISADKVQVTGMLRGKIQNAEKRMLSEPYTKDFILADLSLKLKRIYTNWSGDLSGRWIEVMSKISDITKEEYPLLKEIIRELPQYQRADGHFGVEQDLESSPDPARDMPLQWGHGRLLIGLVEYYKKSRDGNILNIAKRMGDYCIDAGDYYLSSETAKKTMEWRENMALCFSVYKTATWIEGLVGLFHLTNEKKYLDEAKRIAGAVIVEDKLEKVHTHGFLTGCRGLLDLYQITGDKKYLKEVEEKWDAIVSCYLYLSGGLRDYFVIGSGTDEGCTEADWMRLNLRLWQLTGKMKYLDMAEWNLYNHFFVNQFPNGGFGHRWMYLGGGKECGFDHDVEEAYWCCAQHGLRALYEVVRSIYAVRGDEVFVNIFFTNKAEIELSRGILPVEMSVEGIGERISLKFNHTKPLDFTLRLRIPRWAEGIKVKSRIGQSQDGYLVIKKRWQPGETLDIKIEMGAYIRTRVETVIKSVKTPQFVPSAGLFYGPYLLSAIPASSNQCLFSKEKDGHLPTLLVHTDSKGRVSIPVKTEIKGAEMFKVSLPAVSMPYPDKPDKKAKGWKKAELVPLMQTNSQHGKFLFNFWVLPK